MTIWILAGFFCIAFAALAIWALVQALRLDVREDD